MYVNVPWTDNNTTYSAGTGLSLSGTTFAVRLSYTTSGKNYKVQADSNGNLYVNVPWTDTNTNTTYSAGTGLSLSGTTFSVKTGYTTSGKNYKVQADSSGNLYVNVPWTDNNTTYSFSDKNVTLSWGTKSTIATVGGTDIHVTMPSNPNTNTWRGIQNNLTSTSTTDSLSAAMGKSLNDKLGSTIKTYFYASTSVRFDFGGNTPIFVFVRAFSGTPAESGIYSTLTGYPMQLLAGGTNISVSSSGSTYTFTHAGGAVLHAFVLIANQSAQ